jgi:MscS family membrane protein
VRPRPGTAAALLVAATLLLHVAAVAAAPPPLVGGDTPRRAVRGFLAAARDSNFSGAASYLDLRRRPPAARPAQGRVLAQQLWVVLDRALAPDPEQLSDDLDGQPDDGLPPRVDRVGTIVTRRGPVDILLQRVTNDEGDPVWRVAAGTVAQIPALYAELGYGVVEDLLPRPLLAWRVLDIALWQWIALLLLIVLAYGASWIAARSMVRLLEPMVRRSRTSVDERFLEALIGPARLAIGLLLVAVAVLALGLPLAARDAFAGLERAAGIIIVAWALVRLVDVGAGMAVERLRGRGRPAAVSMVPLGSKAAKVLVIALSVIATLQNVGMNVTGILAGLGIGGLAIALAAQKTVENLFGGITLILDQPVRVGDFCRFGDRVGTIEDVGLRSTRVRTLDRTVVSVPNGQFSALPLENFSARDRIWFHPKIGLRYETTPDQLRYVLVEIRTLLYAHPMVDPDPARIRFVGFGDSSLDLEVFAYVRTADYGEFLAVCEDLYLRIMEIVAASGTGFAFPSQTLYMAADSGVDAARTRAAEAQVAAWRREAALCLPDFPDDAIAALRDTLAYPADGAAARKPASG